PLGSTEEWLRNQVSSRISRAAQETIAADESRPTAAQELVQTTPESTSSMADTKVEDQSSTLPE
ncbi:MAG: hypothetical protein ACREBS_09385, partial [Nitrososphaerales archaeon]